MNIGAVVLDYKAHQRVEECVHMLLEMQLFSFIVIVDNSCELNEKKYPSINDNSIYVINNESNIGYGPGINKGIDWLLNNNIDKIVLINYDIKVSKKTVIKCIDALDDKHPIASSIMRNPDESIDQSYWDLMAYRDYVRLLFYGSSKKYINKRKQKVYDDLNKPLPFVDAQCVRESFMVVDANYIKESGHLFDDYIFMFCEADAIGYRLYENGYSSKVLLGASYYHHHEYKKIKAKSDKSYYVSALYMLKNYLKVGSLKIFLFKVLFLFGRIEHFFIYLLINVKRLFKK